MVHQHGMQPSSGFTLSYDGTEWVPAIEGFEYFFGPSLTQNPAANVYSSWSDMFAAIALQPVGVTPIIWIMENATVPAGTWNMALGTLKSPVYVTGAITLLCPAGVTLDNLASIENGLVVEMSPTVAGSALTFSAGIGAEVLLVGLAAALRNTGTAPLWVTPGTGTTVVLGINGVPWNAFSPPAITAPIIQGTAGDTIILSSALSLTQMPADWIAGTGTLVLSLPTNEEPVTLSGWLGTTITNQAQVVYPALSAQYAGSVAAAPVPSGGSYSCVRGDELVRVAPTGVGGISVTLIAPSTCAGQTTTVKKVTSDVIDAITVSAAAGNIDGAASYVLPASAYSVLSFRSDGSDWWVV